MIQVLSIALLIAVLSAYTLCSSKSREISSMALQIERINKSKLEYKTALEFQTSQIEKMAIDTQKRIEELESTPPEIKYKTITKDIIKEIVITKEATCEDTKNLIGNIRNIDINSL